MCWVAIAVALRHAFPGVRTRAGVLIAGFAIAIAVGLSRIYLRAHWFSDVAGGWGLAATCFATAGMIALVVGFLRAAAGARRATTAVPRPATRPRSAPAERAAEQQPGTARRRSPP